MVLTRLFFAVVGTGWAWLDRNWSQICGDEARFILASTALAAILSRWQLANVHPPVHRGHYKLQVLRQAGIITGAQPPGGTPSRHRSFPARLGVVAAAKLTDEAQPGEQARRTVLEDSSSSLVTG